MQIPWLKTDPLPEVVAPGGDAIVAEHLSVTIDGTAILCDVSLTVRGGEVLALVGPNGAGKSTLLAVLSGDLKPSRGDVAIGGRSITAWSPLELARLRAVLTQESAMSFPFRAGQVVAMGRNPWLNTPHADEDHEAISSAIEQTDVVHLSSRRFTSLSGGEKARVSLARVLAQRTGIVLLDEPTAALDLRHQEDVMKVAASLAQTGRAVVVVLHDLSLAAAYAHRVAVMAAGKLAAVGHPNEIFDAVLLEKVYGVPVEIIRQESTGRPLVVPIRSRPL